MNTPTTEEQPKRGRQLDEPSRKVISIMYERQAQALDIAAQEIRHQRGVKLLNRSTLVRIAIDNLLAQLPALYPDVFFAGERTIPNSHEQTA
jgi:hypothetical protein